VGFLRGRRVPAGQGAGRVPRPHPPAPAQPQGRVLLRRRSAEPGAHAGASVADAIFTHAQTIEQGQAFRTELRERAAAKGRDPENLLIVPGVFPIVADTDTEARAKEEAIGGSKSFERALAELGRPFGWHDFSQYDLDAPFPEVGDAGALSFRTQAEKIKKLARESNLTLRQVVEQQLKAHRSPFVGSPLTVANEIQRWFEAGAFDGISISVSAPSEFARFTGQVLPILRERGVVRSEYESATLRGHLGLPIPENRYTAARRAAETVADEPAGQPPTPALA